MLKEEIKTISYLLINEINENPRFRVSNMEKILNIIFRTANVPVLTQGKVLEELRKFKG